MKKYVGIVVALLLAASAAPAVAGVAISYDGGGGGAVVGGILTCGFQFKVSTPIIVTELGSWSDPVKVTLWKYNTTTPGWEVLDSVTTSGTIDAGFYWGDISDQILNTVDKYAVGALYQIGNGNHPFWGGTWSEAPVLRATAGGAFEYEGKGTEYSGDGVPTVPAASVYYYTGGNFKYGVIPEPAGPGLIGMALLAVRKRRK